MDSKILLAGIGGQGVLFIHQVLADCAVANGMDVTGAETHGMSQRGGSVVSHLKIGTAVAPLIREGTADVVLAFDESEAYRNLAFARPGGTVIVNSSGAFPDDRLRAQLDARRVRICTFDANKIAGTLGRTTVANVALLGFACTCAGFPLSREAVRETVEKSARSQTLELNLSAFDQGVQAGILSS